MSCHVCHEWDTFSFVVAYEDAHVNLKEIKYRQQDTNECIFDCIVNGLLFQREYSTRFWGLCMPNFAYDFAVMGLAALYPSVS